MKKMEITRLLLSFIAAVFAYVCIRSNGFDVERLSSVFCETANSTSKMDCSISAILQNVFTLEWSNLVSIVFSTLAGVSVYVVYWAYLRQWLDDDS
jgi:hypothetical protein